MAVVGNVDAGKSTLLGVLTHGELDNGRGMARQRLFRHKHEMESGRTSSVGNDILGFDSRGDVVNKPDTHGKQDKQALCIRLQNWLSGQATVFDQASVTYSVNPVLSKSSAVASNRATEALASVKIFFWLRL